MATKRTKHLYEILIRFNADGFQGAHVKDLERISENGEVLVEREGDARPATLEEVGQYLGAESAKLIEAADTARKLADQHEAVAAAALTQAEDAKTDALARITAAESAQKQAEDAQAMAVAALRQALAVIAPD